MQIETMLDSQYGLGIYIPHPPTKQMHTPAEKGRGGSRPRIEPGEIAMQASISVLSPADVVKILNELLKL